MAMTIDSTLHLQPTDEASLDAECAETLTLEWKGTYAACKATADTIEPGEAIPTVAGGNAYTPAAALYGGYNAVSWTVRRGNGDTGILVVVCKKADPTTTQQEHQSTTPFRTVYSVKSVRNDVSVLRYCSTSPSGPNRAAVERWMKEPDPKLAADFKYTDASGDVVDMNEEPLLKATVPLIRKIMMGVERVIRFYPQLTIKRQYHAPPIAIFDKLSYIDTPPAPGEERTLKPSGVAALINAHQWLKVQDDCDEQQDSTWMRTESWIGILKTDKNNGTPWNADLYGENRWQMPHDASDPNQQDSDAGEVT